jgi:hypothetical protein
MRFSELSNKDSGLWNESSKKGNNSSKIGNEGYCYREWVRWHREEIFEIENYIFEIGFEAFFGIAKVLWNRGWIH